MKLYLKNLSVECIIGDLPRERVEKQILEIDLELDIPDKAAETDDLADTVDYAALAEKISGALVEAECRMIERAARIAAEKCLEDARVRYAKALVTKRGAVPALGAAAAMWEAAR